MAFSARFIGTGVSSAFSGAIVERPIMSPQTSQLFLQQGPNFYGQVVLFLIIITYSKTMVILVKNSRSLSGVETTGGR